MPSTGPLVGIRSKIERTKKHVADLDEAIRAFLNASPYKIGTKRDSDTRRLIYYVSHVDDVPTDIIPQIASDAFCNMVSILDHLAYRLFIKGGAGGDGRHVYFPISRSATNPTEYETSCKGKIKGIPQPVVDALFAIEAYKGGKGHQLWVLNELNNLSKHRDLIAVGSRFRSFDMGAYLMPSMDEGRRALERITGKVIALYEKFSWFLEPADHLCPLKAGDELFNDAPDAEVNDKLQFRFDIALNEPQIIQAEPMIETVHHLADLVSKIVDQFVSFL